MESNHNPKKYLFYCFHGTTKVNADKIIREKEFKYNNRKDHWLGNGVYFFIDDADKAKWWASKCIKDNGEKAVIETEVCIDENRLFNLDTERARSNLDNFMFEFISKLNKKKFKIKVLDKLSMLELRCLCLDLISKENSYQAVKYTFSDSKIKYKCSSGLFEGAITNNACQLCVTDYSIIDLDKMRVCPVKEA